MALVSEQKRSDMNQLVVKCQIKLVTFHAALGWQRKIIDHVQQLEALRNKACMTRKPFFAPGFCFFHLHLTLPT